MARYIASSNAGKLAAALVAAQEACAAEPDTPSPYYALGKAQTALGNDTGAVHAFADTLRRPGLGGAWVNLGLALYRQGSIRAAKMAMRKP